MLLCPCFVLQLYHVKSRKYVKVLNGKLAKGERENMKVNLDIQGDSYSWFQVYPRYRIDRYLSVSVSVLVVLYLVFVMI